MSNTAQKDSTLKLLFKVAAGIFGQVSNGDAPAAMAAAGYAYDRATGFKK